MSEELWESHKTYEKTSHPDIFRSGHEDLISNASLRKALKQLEVLIAASEPARIIALLDEVVPGASIRATPPPPDLTSVV